MPHFTWDISFGQLIVSIPIFALLGIILVIHRNLMCLRIEHELLMIDWAARQTPPVKLEALFTRKKIFWT